MNQVYEGIRKRMACLTVVGKIPAIATTAEWLFEGRKMTADSRVTIQHGYLTITSTRGSDTGNYRCTEKLNGRQTTSAAKKLTVFSK